MLSTLRRGSGVVSRVAMVSAGQRIGARLSTLRTVSGGRFTVGAAAQQLKQSAIYKRSLSTDTMLPAQTNLLSASGRGDLKSVKDCIAQGAKVNVGDYDHRRALHLAAAEGKQDVVEWLLANGADVTVTDRWGNTCLDDAIIGARSNIVKLLRKHKATVGVKNAASTTQMLCTAAALADIPTLQLLLDAGVDVNSGDYDKRTPLHLAASEGKTTAVEFLLKNKANVNAIDRFGNTPLSDALRGRGRSNNNVAKILEEAGASRGSPEFAIKNVPHVRGAISRMLPHLLAKYNFVFSEAWLPTDGDVDFQLLETWGADKESNLRAPASAPVLVSNDPKTHLGQAYRSKKCIALDAIGAEEQLPQLRAIHSFDNIKSCVVAPVLFGDTCVAVIKLYAADGADKRGYTQAYFDEVAHYMTGIFTAGVFKGEVPLKWDEVPDLPKGQMNEVFRLIVAEEVFNASLVYAEVDWFYHLGLQKYYFQRFDAHTIAKHVHSFIAAKKLAATTGNPEDIWLDHHGKKGPDGVTKTALFMTPTDHSKMVVIENRLQEKISKIPSNVPYTMEFFLSEKTIVPHGQKRLALYTLQTSEWANPAKMGTSETSIWEVASELFLKDKTKAIRDRYQELINKAATKLSPVAEVFETYRDGTTPIMFAFAQAGPGGAQTSYMLQLTELLRKNDLQASRKFIETMANGIIVYSLYIKPTANLKKSIDTLLHQFSLLHLVPQSPLTPLFLNGDLSAETYTYASAGAKFIYYFLNKRSEEFNQLADAFKDDPLNLGRLRLLQTRLKREAVSRERIFSCLLAHPDLVQELYAHFAKVATTAKPSAEVRANIDLVKRIQKEALSDVDAQILNGFVALNQHTLKTNFYNKSKSSIAFRVDPNVLANSNYEKNPFAIFFLMGSEFQGFHVRFSDIARGGIRVIRSADPQVYNHNLESQFQENYGLAFTQNLKNKDIPEFGSKGTILLNPGSVGKDGRLVQPNSFLAFQKYVSGLLDVITPNEAIVDNYGKEEILFLGPDEGSADFMEWAAKYAEKRGYKWWRSFTTGKPPAMGGVPHDSYGMTTRGVHRFVVNCLAKLKLDETKVTKLQTGGPDGDLGSNEILLSKDKTIAIVDGSGVVYDPAGLQRDEITRLAKKRVMIKDFDLSKLGSGGFRVLTSEKNVKLPNGEFVENGMVFRNDFHLHPLAAADMFVPCGGRPESVNLTNVRRLLNEKGVPRFKIIVEGANLFFTQDARMVMEEKGVILYKDASANKGGVTSSSLEVLAALALNGPEFQQHMSATDPKNIPKFYAEYVAEIQRRIENDADLEFECIWREHLRTGTPRYILTDQVSNKINSLNEFVQQSSLYRDEGLRKLVMAEAIPKQLQKLVGLEQVMARLPPSYTQAIFGAYLASRYVYKHGLAANEFAFFEFMQPYLKR